MSIPMMIVLSFEVESPEDAVKLLEAIDPPSLPMFGGQARIVVGDDVVDVVEFLDGDE